MHFNLLVPDKERTNVVVCVKSLQDGADVSVFNHFRKQSNIAFFGVHDHVVSADAIFSSDMDLLAKIIYDTYRNEWAQDAPVWEKISYADKEPNRESADHMDVKKGTSSASSSSSPPPSSFVRRTERTPMYVAGGRALLVQECTRESVVCLRHALKSPHSLAWCVQRSRAERALEQHSITGHTYCLSRAHAHAWPLSPFVGSLRSFNLIPVRSADTRLAL